MRWTSRRQDSSLLVLKLAVVSRLFSASRVAKDSKGRAVVLDSNHTSVHTYVICD